MDKKSKNASAVLDQQPPSDLPRVGGSFGQMRMDFPAAMRALLRGGRVTRQEWNNSQWYVFVDEEYLMIHRPEGSNHQLLLRVGDMFGEDWVVVDKEN